MSDFALNQFRWAHRLRVRWAEVDMQRIVFNPHYLMYIDTALTEYWRVMAIPYETIPTALGGELYVKKSTVQYHGSARLDDRLDIGTRLVQEGPQRARIARMAVIRTLRGTGFGRLALEALVQQAAERGDTQVLVQSRCSAKEFYTRLGFLPTSEPYDQAGIAHIDMARAVPSV
jgi:YbgC/YbaW family acyl-CoA thioester hydrolase